MYMFIKNELHELHTCNLPTYYVFMYEIYTNCVHIPYVFFLTKNINFVGLSCLCNTDAVLCMEHFNLFMFPPSFCLFNGDLILSYIVTYNDYLRVIVEI